jgi:glyoxylase-like metal-dependent hydrolase (beta-lactamase superfamily II)/rhodanese-related sulfurtransferase
MTFQAYYLSCLAHASYMVGDGEVVIIDPQRDVEQYLVDAKEMGVRIAHIVETHLHADFVSGHLELARRTHATVHISHLAGAEYPHRPVRDGDTITMGRVTLRVLETPGHTPESISLVQMEDGRPVRLFSGDTLFIGEVGRPDLAAWRGHSRDEMARAMYRSLRDKVLPLPDSVEVWPAHGAGSACGKSISDERCSTLGRQKVENWGLRLIAAGDEEAFLSELTAGLPSIPPYFPHDVDANRRGAPAVREILNVARPFAPESVESEMARGAVVLDTRDPGAFARSHVPGAINVPLDGKFAPWVGVAIPARRRLVLVADEGREDESVMRLTRIGYDSVEGWLRGGVESWKTSGRPISSVAEITAEAMAERCRGGSPRLILDVRTGAEWDGGHLEGALHIPLLDLSARLSEVPRGPLTLLCGSGYRSSIACSLLARQGWSDLENVVGGWAELAPALAKHYSS